MKLDAVRMSAKEDIAVTRKNAVPRHTFSVISQTRPSARQSKCVFPECLAIIRSIIRPPNPMCVGSCTFGPFNSAQRRCNRPSTSCDQFSSTWPPGTARAPYLAALVANSCKVIANDLSNVRLQQHWRTVHAHAPLVLLGIGSELLCR